LFARSGWTQEELAKKEHKSRFGWFLIFFTNVNNAENSPLNLTERRFRDYWERLDAAGASAETGAALLCRDGEHHLE